MHAWSLARRLALAQLLGLLLLTALASWVSYSYAREGIYWAQSDRVLTTARLLAQEQGVVPAAYAAPERYGTPGRPENEYRWSPTERGRPTG